MGFILFYWFILLWGRLSPWSSWGTPGSTRCPFPPCSGPGSLTSVNDCILGSPHLWLLVELSLGEGWGGKHREGGKKLTLPNSGLTEFPSALESAEAMLCPWAQRLTGDPLPGPQLLPGSMTPFSVLDPLGLGNTFLLVPLPRLWSP